MILAAIIAILVLLAGTFVFLEFVGPPRTFVLELTGKPGLEVVGTIEEYRAKRDVTLTLPAKLELKGQHIFFEFVPRAGALNEPIELQVTVDGIFYGSVKSAPGVRGDVHWPRLLGPWRKNAWFGGMSREEAERIRK